MSDGLMQNQVQPWAGARPPRLGQLTVHVNLVQTLILFTSMLSQQVLIKPGLASFIRARALGPDPGRQAKVVSDPRMNDPSPCELTWVCTRSERLA